MADIDTLAKILAQKPEQPKEQNSLEGGIQRQNPIGWWGPKTATDDAPYYLPESLVGDWLYRHQGVLLHGGMAALPMATFPRLLNALYAGGTMALGRTAPTKRVDLPAPELPPDLPPELKK
jgi:hypothetical protein